ncbi:MAG: carbohydrate ABC transporter permease [Christensenellaceae bacterium]|jgi:putative aldouronate transport system permease protein|nr:carbohydrate ABC transporter permease [Christensenellaceae bacterium]
MAQTAITKSVTDRVLKENRIRRFGAIDFVILLFLSLWGLLILYPFYNAVLVSIVPNTVYQRYQGFMLLPPAVTWDSYAFTFKNSLIWTGYRTTLAVTVLGTAYNMAMTILCGYALTKTAMPGIKVMRFLLVFTMWFSGGLIPYYLQIKNLHLTDNLLVMVLPMGVNLMYLLIISDNFRSIPASLEESAKIDGANDWTVLIRIILPLCLPLLATFTLYYAVERWNEWYHAMLFIKTSSKWPLQNVLRTIINDVNMLATMNIPGQVRPDVQGDSIKMSSIVVSMLPMMCLYPFLQRYFLSGLTLGAVKE